MPLSSVCVESCGRIGRAALTFISDVKYLNDVTAARDRRPKGASVRWDTQLLSVALQKGNTETHRRSGLASPTGALAVVGHAVWPRAGRPGLA